MCAKITVGADGRFSALRRLGGFDVEYQQHSFDVMWFTIPEPADAPAAFRMFLTARRAYLALPKHPSLIQCGMLLPVGGFAQYQHDGLETLRRDLLAGPVSAASPWGRRLFAAAAFVGSRLGTSGPFAQLAAR